MKKTTLLLAAAGLVISAIALLFSPAASTAPASGNSRHRTKAIKRNPPAATGQPRHSERETDFADTADAENFAAWQERLAALESELGSRDQALRALLEEIDATYRTWVTDQLTPVGGLPPAERYDLLADIGHAMTEGTVALLEQLGVEESRHHAVVAGPSEAIAAETQYAEAANDPTRRLALLRLDREREDRLEQALALPDETARTRAVSELDAWYDAGLGGIFTPSEP